MKTHLLPVYSFARTHFLSLSLFFTALCITIILSVKIIFMVSHHPDISGSERTTTYGIQVVAADLPLYQNPSLPPFWITHYSPLYYQIVGNIYAFTGWDVNNIFRVQFVSRVVSFIFILAALWVTFITLKLLHIPKYYRPFALALLFGLLQHWYFTNSRIDSLLFLCLTLFIYFMLRSFQEKESWNIYVIAAVIMSMIAFFTKQIAYMYVAGWVGYFVWMREWKNLLRASILCLCLLVLFTFLLGGHDTKLFYINLIGSLIVRLEPWGYYGFTYKQLIPHFAVLIGMSSVLALKGIFNQSDKSKVFLGIATLLFFIFSTANAFKYGAGVGYFHEFAYVSLLSVFCYFSEKVAKSYLHSDTHYFFVSIILLTLLYFTTTQLERLHLADFNQYTSEYNQQNDVKKYLEPRLKQGEYIAVLYGDNFRGMLLQQMLFKHNLAYQDDVIRELYLSKRINFDAFFDLDKRGGVKYVIAPVGQSYYYPAFNHHFDSTYYRLETEIHGYKLYRFTPQKKRVASNTTRS